MGGDWKKSAAGAKGTDDKGARPSPRALSRSLRFEEYRVASAAAVQNDVLDKYHANIDKQIKQVDGILAVAATQTQQLGTVVDFLDKFVYALPKAIPTEWTQVYMWGDPCLQDPRSPSGCP